MNSTCLGFHGVSSSVAASKPFNEKPYFPPKPSVIHNPSFFFQPFSQEPHLSFSHNANRLKSISKTTTCCYRETFSDFPYKRRGRFIPMGDDDYLVYSYYDVGTKFKLAVETGIYETIGIDLVAMTLNDIITSGAKPSVMGHLFSSCLLGLGLCEKVVKGALEGCEQSDCEFIGGKAINKADFCATDYELWGSAQGIVKKDSVIDGKNIVAGDVIVGLPSSVVHWSGFSLVRRALAQSGLSLKDQLPGGSGKPITFGEALMTPTVIYVKQVLDIISKGGVKGIAHITGGGLTDDIPGVFQEGLGATIYQDSWEVPAVFKWIQEAGRIEDAEMRRTFNMGIGMVLVVNPDAAARILGEQRGGYSAYLIGEVTSREGVTYQ
ncbi:hypothetical protein AAC387_Pa04g2779 [Persea americana]